MKLIDELRLKTYNEAVELLDTYGKACIIRPTGFGKTGILTRLIKDHIKKARVLKLKYCFYIRVTQYWMLYLSSFIIRGLWNIERCLM